jgi:hypothetical protein
VARRVLAAGNEIGSLTFTHVQPGATPTSRLDIGLTLTSKRGRRGNRSPARPGAPALLVAARRGHQRGLRPLRRIGVAGYLVALADLDSKDWQRPGVAPILDAA